MYAPETMMSMYTAHSAKGSDLFFHLRMLYREVIVQMNLKIRDPDPLSNHRMVGQFDRDDIIRFSIPFSQLEMIHELHYGHDRVALLIALETPPRFSRKVDESLTHEKAGRFWSERDAWYRQTDIVYDPDSLKESSLTLKKTKPLIDLGKLHKRLP